MKSWFMRRVAAQSPLLHAELPDVVNPFALWNPSPVFEIMTISVGGRTVSPHGDARCARGHVSANIADSSPLQQTLAGELSPTVDDKLYPQKDQDLD
jgi:hypothetical protein